MSAMQKQTRNREKKYKKNVGQDEGDGECEGGGGSCKFGRVLRTGS